MKCKYPIFGSNTSYCCQKRSKDLIVFGLKENKNGRIEDRSWNEYDLVFLSFHN